jgi:tetratricopeptide (TPR) repeat protein
MLRSLKAEWYFFLGRVFYKRLRYKAAARQFECGLKLHPLNVSAQCYLGLCCYQQLDYQSGIAAFDRALQIRPDCGYAHGGIGQLLVHLGRDQEAADAINRAIRINPEYGEKARYLEFLGIAYSNIGQYQKAYETLRKADSLSANDEVIAYWLGTTLTYLGRSKEAADAINHAIRIQPKFGEKASYVRFLGIAYSKIGQNEKASEILRKANNLGPNDAETLYWLGRTLVFLKRYEEAERPLRKAVALEPDNYHAHGELGIVLYALQKWDESVDEYKKHCN